MTAGDHGGGREGRDQCPTGVRINGAKRDRKADIDASNGVIHVIDTVLMPPSEISPVAEIRGLTSRRRLARLPRDLVTVREQPGELPPREAGTDGAPEATEGKLVLDVVGQRALVRVARSDDVAMEPLREWSALHPIGEHHAGLVGHVLGLDGLPERTTFVRNTTMVPTASEVGAFTISVRCHGGWSRAKASGASWNANTTSAALGSPSP